MSPRGRRASLPPVDHARPEYVTPNGLVVHHYNREGRVKDYDFSTLPVAEPMQRALAALFAARCTPHYWTVHMTSKQHWFRMTQFTTYLSHLDRPPRDLHEVTATLVRHWRESLAGTADGYSTFDTITRLLRSDTRLQAGLVADELATRLRQPDSTVQSYSEAEFEQITVAARRTFRTALGRIEENIGHLAAWREGTFAEGGRDWVLGEALEVMAQGEALPCYVDKNGRRSLPGKYRRALGGMRCKRLFLSRTEAAALGVLLLAEFGWNLSMIDRLEVPRASPDPGDDGRPTYRVPLEKPRRGAGRTMRRGTSPITGPPHRDA